MKQIAFAAGSVALGLAMVGAVSLVIAGEIPLTGYRFSGSTLRGPGIIGLALGIAGAGAIAFFSACIAMWPKSRDKFEPLRTASLVIAGLGMILAVFGGYMARAGVGAT